MEAKDRIIVALDVDRLEKALELVEEIHNYCGYSKAGLELLTSEGAPRVISAIQKAGGKIFFDGKFKDIPNTVAAASRAVTKLGVDMFNVHCLGGEAMMKAAVKVAEEISEIQRRRRPIILGVTLLTSLDYSDLVEMGIYDELNIADPEELAQIKKERIERLVIKLVLLAQESGLDGVICSPQEIRIIRQWCQPEFLIATPDVRPVWAAIGDQKRVMTPGEAILAGADYLVIDRPITQPPAEIGGPVAAAKAIIKEITDALKIKDVPPEIMHDDIINA